MAPAEERARLHKLLQAKGLDAVAPAVMRAPYTPPVHANKASTVVKEEPVDGRVITAESEAAKKNDTFAFSDREARSRSAAKAVIRVPCKLDGSASYRYD